MAHFGQEDLIVSVKGLKNATFIPAGIVFRDQHRRAALTQVDRPAGLLGNDLKLIVDNQDSHGQFRGHSVEFPQVLALKSLARLAAGMLAHAGPIVRSSVGLSRTRSS